MSKNILSEKAVLASLSISRWTARRFDKKVTNQIHRQHGAASDVGRYTKRLIAVKAMADIESAVTAARNYHYEHTQPWFDQGARLLPSALYLEFARKMQEFRQQFESAADEFQSDYPNLVSDARLRLNGMFDERDYPSQREIRRRFEFDVAILPCPDTTANDFRIALSNEHAEDIRRDIERRMENALHRAEEDTAARILDVVGHMADRLSSYKPKKGTKKAEGIFHDSLVENVRDLAKLLPAFNLANDPKLAKITAQIEHQLCKHDAEALRDDPAMRKIVAASADDILASVKAFMA